VVRVLSQPRWAFWKYDETYEFDLDVAGPEVSKRIAAFYQTKGATAGDTQGPAALFTRGSIPGSLFSPVERHHKQTCSVTVQPVGPGATVRCTYHCWDPYPNLHVDPRPLQAEVELLAAGLSADAGSGGPPVAPSAASAAAPAWVWTFVAACLLIPLISLGGAIPGALGAGSAFACHAVGSNSKRSTRSRALLCAAVTAGAWMLFLALVVVQVARQGPG
jgi:hypothetical protein